MQDKLKKEELAPVYGTFSGYEIGSNMLREWLLGFPALAGVMVECSKSQAGWGSAVAHTENGCGEFPLLIRLYRSEGVGDVEREFIRDKRQDWQEANEWDNAY